LSIAYFISPHGFGHAARATAVMQALRELDEVLNFEVFTRVPPWFFEESLAGAFRCHDVLTDIGLAQATSLTEDIPETVRRLDRFLPFDEAQVDALAAQVTQFGCRLVLCDIAPLGIAVAQAAGVPSVLIENFTWDWIYAGYVPHDSRMEGYSRYLRRWFRSAAFHIQTAPVCDPLPVDLTTAPVSRKPTTPADRIRQKLGVPLGAQVVLITMGGVPWEFTSLEPMLREDGIYFVIPGAAAEHMQRRDNLVLLPRRTGFYHPDLVRACDAVIGKAGYSTLAEAFWAGVPFGYVARQWFRESHVLTEYIEAKMHGVPIPEQQLRSGEWISRLPDLLAQPRVRRPGQNGAEQIAQFVCGLL
jgi:UDP:flavonoid glycosyltransferase YjiC (YdhE family)